MADKNIDENCRYQFNFNGDGYIQTAKRWNPDAVDPSFTVEFYNDTSQVLNNQFFKQGDNFGDFSIRTQSLGGLGLYLGGSGFTILSENDDGLGLWRVEYFHSSSVCNVYREGVLVNTRNGVTIGATRTPNDPIEISDQDTGIMADVKMWINTETTNELILDMPINDNSATIKDYSDNEQDGTLTAGTGQWQAKREGDCSICELSHEGGSVLTGFGEKECK